MLGAALKCHKTFESQNTDTVVRTPLEHGWSSKTCMPKLYVLHSKWHACRLAVCSSCSLTVEAEVEAEKAENTH